MILQNAGGTAATVGGSLTVSTIAAEATDVDKFLVSNAGLVKFRTGAEVASDIGAVSLPVAESDVTFSATGHDHDGTGSENVDYTNLDSIPASFTPAAHVLATSGPHTGTLPVAEIANGTDGYYLKAGASNPVYEQRTFTIGGSILSPTDTTYVIAFRAPFAATAVEINARQKGGSSTIINARKNGTSNLLASNLTLTSADTWYNDAADQNQSFAVDDWLEIMVVTAASATEVFIQVEFTEA
jgi:hypothetical protein